MAERCDTASEWLSAHQPEYEQLFDDGLATALPANLQDTQLPLSALTRYTYMGRRPRKTEYITMAEVAQGVAQVVRSSSDDLFGPEHSVLKGMEPDSHDGVIAASTEIICRWERACLRNGLRSPFEDMVIESLRPDDIALNATRLVIATAASVAGSCHFRINHISMRRSGLLADLNTMAPD